MSTADLKEIEKMERFYLSSCTELPVHLAKSMHQSFPALTDIVANQKSVERVYECQTRSPSGRFVTIRVPASDLDTTAESKNRAKLFFKICNSLVSGTDSIAQDSSYSTVAASKSLIINPSMSKQEFINKLDEGMFRYTDSNENYAAENGALDGNRKYTKSDSVLAKSTGGTDDTGPDSQSTSKSTTAISRNGTTGRNRGIIRNTRTGNTTSTTSKMIVTGIILLVFLGFLKNASTR